MPSPLSKLLNLALKAYKATLSPLFGRRCRFHPSCSEYMVEAIQKKGMVLGALKGIWRVLRCHPLSRGGYDPVK